MYTVFDLLSSYLPYFICAT